MRRDQPTSTESGEIGELLKLAGRRPMPDSARMSEAREVARAEWARSLEPPRRRPRWFSMPAVVAATATALGLAAWIALSWTRVPLPLVEVATLQTNTGPLLVLSADSTSQALATAGTRLHAGDRLETPGGGRAALALNGGIEVRIDEMTSAILENADGLRLERGTVYIDAGRGERASSFRVRTALGDVRHLGTQFEVRVRDGALRVRVREGAVVVQRDQMQWTSRAREELLVRPGTAPARQPIAISGADWQWVTGLAQSPRLDGMTVPAFLDWASREQGLRWEYEHPGMREPMARVVVHGALEKLTPEEALAAVLPTCGLTARTEGERLIVGRMFLK